VGIGLVWFWGVLLNVTLRLFATAPRFALSRCGLGTWPGRFLSDSDKIQIFYENLGFLSSLRSKLPYVPTLRAS
jgi:hypothetical protein